jgi:lysophospholipase L1-like esterase
MLLGIRWIRSFFPRYIGTPLILACLLLLLTAPIAFASSQGSISLVGPKQRYLALGDSLAFGYQPDLNYADGYSTDFYNNLQGHGVHSYANMGCPGETSNSLINGGCPYPFLRKYPYIGAQLNAALDYLAYYKGQVSPVTLDIGANDLLPDINNSTCAVNTAKYTTDLATLDANLTQIILPKLHNALVVNGKLTGDLLVMNNYDPYQNSCPNTVSYIQQINQHIASDVSNYGTMVDVFSAFGGAKTPNSNICSYTWICSVFKDIHATDKGYSAIASAFEQGAGY